MSLFTEGCDRQRLLLADCIDDYVGEDSNVRVVDVFIDELDLTVLGFEEATATGRPGYLRRCCSSSVCTATDTQEGG